MKFYIYSNIFDKSILIIQKFYFKNKFDHILEFQSLNKNNITKIYFKIRQNELYFMIYYEIMNRKYHTISGNLVKYLQLYKKNSSLFQYEFFKNLILKENKKLNFRELNIEKIFLLCKNFIWDNHHYKIIVNYSFLNKEFKLGIVNNNQTSKYSYLSEITISNCYEEEELIEIAKKLLNHVINLFYFHNTD